MGSAAAADVDVDWALAAEGRAKPSGPFEMVEFELQPTMMV